MKAMIIGVLILLAVVSIFQATASTTNPGSEYPFSWTSHANSKIVENKMTEALRGLNAARDVNSTIKNAWKAGGPLNNMSIINSSALNSTAVNSSAINSTGINSSAMNKSDLRSKESAGYGSFVISDGSSASTQGVSSISKANFNGFYGIQANKHEMGKNDIKSRMFLRGGFEVDKTVQFTDRGI